MDKKEIKEIIEKEVQERIREERQKIREEVKSEIQDGNKESLHKSNEMSRKGFLRKLGAGTISLGALSLIPSSALNVRSDGFSFYGGSGSGLDLDIDNSGNIQIYGDLTAKDGETIWDESSSHVPSNVIQTSGLNADTVDGKNADQLGKTTPVPKSDSVQFMDTAYFTRSTEITGLPLEKSQLANMDISRIYI